MRTFDTDRVCFYSLMGLGSLLIALSAGGRFDDLKIYRLPSGQTAELPEYWRSPAGAKLLEVQPGAKWERTGAAIGALISIGGAGLLLPGLTRRQREERLRAHYERLDQQHRLELEQRQQREQREIVHQDEMDAFRKLSALSSASDCLSAAVEQGIDPAIFAPPPVPVPKPAPQPVQPAQPPQDSHQAQVQPVPQAATNGLEFYDWDSLYDDATGIMLVGNPGSAKSTAAVWLLGKLTQSKQAQVLALDIHGNTNPNWARFGIPVISRPEAIEQQLELLDQLLLARREMSPAELARQDDVIVINDELGGCLTEFKKPEIVKRTIDRLGAQGRKYRITLVTISHSKNSEDMGGSSAAMLRNYTQILFCAQAVNFAESTWKQDDPRSAYVRSVAYPVVINGAIQAQLAVHPTHGHHAVFRKTGNEPKWDAFLPIQKRPLTIALAEGYEHLGGSQADQLNRLFYRQAEFDVRPETKTETEDNSPSAGLDGPEKELVDWIARRGGQVDERTLIKSCPPSVRQLKAKGIKDLLQSLRASGYLTCRAAADGLQTWEIRPDDHA